jgi:polar amino acid transport system substrate-binding protein
MAAAPTFTATVASPRRWSARQLAPRARAFIAAALLAGWLMGAGPARAAAGSTLERIRGTGVFRWGADQQGGEPYVFEDPQHPGHLVGFEVELAAALGPELARRPGPTPGGSASDSPGGGAGAEVAIRAELVQNDWSTLIPSLERGDFDVALNGIEVTPELSARVAFSIPYCTFHERLVARGDDPRIRDLASLHGLRVGTLAASQAWNTLRSGGAVPVPYEGVDEPLIDLENGRTDAVLLDDIIVDRYLPGHPHLRVVGDVAPGRYAIAMRPQDIELRAAIDAALARLIGSGRLAAIFSRWNLGSHAPTPTPNVTSGTTGEARPSPSAASPTASPMVMAPARFGWRNLALFFEAARVTLLVSTGAMALAIPLGLGLALTRIYTRRARLLAIAYVELFRGTPVLLQLYVLYYGLAPVLRIDAIGAAILGLGLNYAAYESEIHRAGIAAVPPGQTEAALSLGMSTGLALRRIVLPQAARVALPGIANDFIALLKDSSLVSVISVVELTKRMSITAVDTRGWLWPGLTCAAFYFVLSFPLSRLAARLERHLTGA